MLEEKSEIKKVEVADKKTTSKIKEVRPKKRSCFWIVLAIIFVFIFWSSVFRNFAPFFLYSLGGFDDTNPPKIEDIVSIEELSPEQNNLNSTSSKSKINDGGNTTVLNPDNNSSPTDSETPAETTYSFLDFYIDIANTSVSGKDRPTIRWNRPIVYIGGKEGEGALDITYRTCASWFINDFNSNSNFVKLEKNAPLANIKIYFMTEQELIDKYQTKLPFAIPYNNTSGEMIEAKIVMPSDTDWLDDEKCWSLKHEIMHAVGFLGHTNKINNSEMSFSPLYITYGGLSASDQRAIRMLYNSGIPLLTNQQQTRDYFNTHSY
jgi:hypothetical protein